MAQALVSELKPSLRGNAEILMAEAMMAGTDSPPRHTSFELVAMLSDEAGRVACGIARRLPTD